MSSSSSADADAKAITPEAIRGLRFERGARVRIEPDGELSIPTTPTDGEGYETEQRAVDAIEATVVDMRVSTTRAGRATVVGVLELDADEDERVGLAEHRNHPQASRNADPERRIKLEGESAHGDENGSLEVGCRLETYRAVNMAREVGAAERDHTLGDVARVVELESSEGSDS